MSHPHESARFVAALPLPAAVVKGGRYVAVNEEFARLLGRPVETLLSSDPYSFVLPDEIPMLRERNLARRRGERVPQSDEVTIVGEDGARRPLLLEVRPLGDGEHLVVARAIRPEVADLENATLAAIHEVAMLDATVSLDELLPKLLEIAARGTGSDETAIYVMDQDEAGQHLRLAGTTLVNAFSEKYRRLPLQRTATGETAMSTQPRAISVDEWPEGSRADLRAEGYRQTAILPLLANGRIAGTVNLSRRRDERYSPEQLRAGAMLAGQIALQVERARLHDEARGRVADLSRLNELGSLLSQHLSLEKIFQVAVSQVSAMASVRSTFLLLLDADKRALRIVASDEKGETGDLVFWVDRPSMAVDSMRTRAPVLYARPGDESKIEPVAANRFGMNSLLAVPLLDQGEPIGSMVLGDTRPDRKYSEREIDFAVAVANQLASAIANARLYEDVRRSLAELSAAQTELVKRERLAALGELSASVAHEVRNPLGAIFNVLSRLKKSDALPAAEKALLAVVEEESERLNRMVSDLLDFARPHSAEKKPSVLEPVLAAAIEAATWVHANPEVAITLNVEPTLGAVPLDTRLLHQALVNLIGNAFQSMPDGGRIEVRADRAERSGQRCARIDVTDSGPGIPPEMMEKVFLPFFTTRAEGTGLGLSVVKRIADEHDGEVTVESGPTGGATFSLWLPMRPS